MVSFARKVMATVLILGCCRVVLVDYPEHGSTITGAYDAAIIGKVWCTEREETRKVVPRGVVSLGQRTCTQVISSTKTVKNSRLKLLHHPPLCAGFSTEC